MEVHTCDICGEILKGQNFIYSVVKKFYIDYSRHNSPEDAMREYNQTLMQALRATQHKEMCSQCKKLFDYFCSLRKEKVEKLKAEIEKMLQVKKPSILKAKNKIIKGQICNCLMPLDEGEVSSGIPNGICYHCEGVILTNLGENSE